MSWNIVNLILNILILLGAINLGRMATRLAKENRDLIEQKIALMSGISKYQDQFFKLNEKNDKLLEKISVLKTKLKKKSK